MGLTMLRIDTARARWRVKLEEAFVTKTANADREGKSVKYVLFTLPFITVLREGLEAVVFIGGVRPIRSRHIRAHCRLGVPRPSSFFYPNCRDMRASRGVFHRIYHLQDLLPRRSLHISCPLDLVPLPHWIRIVQQGRWGLPAVPVQHCVSNNIDSSLAKITERRQCRSRRGRGR